MGTQRNRWKTDKRFRRSLCVSLFTIGLAVAGVSLAYFTSSDRVVNRVESDYTYSLDIVLTEPKWDSKGEVEARKSVPGMEIDKDPYVTNYLPTDVYVRLKIDFTDGDGNLISRDDENLTLFDYYNTEASQINDDNKNNVYSRFLSAVYYFTEDSSGSSSNPEHLLTKEDSDIQSSNPYFRYENGWFYYLDYEGTNKADLKSLTYKERTKEPLFTTIKLPVFKDEYNDLFANGFRIKVTAQAVDVAKFVDDDENPTISTSSDMDDIEQVFKNEFGS